MKRKKLYKPYHPNCFHDGTIYQYVYVASKLLNRPLKKGQHVHHIDCNPQNNSPQNLMVFATNSDHVKFHKYNLDKSLLVKLDNGTYKIKDNYQHVINRTYVCKTCGKQFISTWSRKSKSQYCSEQCLRKSKSVFKLDANKLQQLVQHYSLSQIGRMYGVSMNTIKKYCIKYKIDYKQYKLKIKSEISKKVMKQKYKDYINKDYICPICGKSKERRSKTCRDCYINKNHFQYDQVIF